jgi:hypothetical protein
VDVDPAQASTHEPMVFDEAHYLIVRHECDLGKAAADYSVL